jgi:hypothetical protein
MRTLDQIISTLSEHRQRATYGAVGAVLKRPARSLMFGRPRSHENSWVVAKRNGRPTGYSETEIAPSPKERTRIIGTAKELESWLGHPS